MDNNTNALVLYETNCQLTEQQINAIKALWDAIKKWIDKVVQLKRDIEHAITLMAEQLHSFCIRVAPMLNNVSEYDSQLSDDYFKQLEHNKRVIGGYKPYVFKDYSVHVEKNIKSIPYLARHY